MVFLLSGVVAHVEGSGDRGVKNVSEKEKEGKEETRESTYNTTGAIEASGRILPEPAHLGSESR